MATNLTAEEFSCDDPAKTVERYESYINPTMSRLNGLLGMEKVAQRARGCYILDTKGDAYLDCLGGFGVFSLGHRCPEVVQAVKRQLDLMPLSAKLMFDSSTAELAEKLALITPGDLQYTFFCNSGAEAVEVALKIARLSMGRPGIISAYNSFHGNSMESFAIAGREAFKEAGKHLLPQKKIVPFGQLEPLRRAIDEETAAIIIEPIQAEGGVIVPPYGYLTGLRKICDEYQILLILDEVHTGLGRTGYMFACDGEEVFPDILTLAEALGGGIMPMGAVIMRPRVFEFMRRESLYHTSTLGGNPLACSAALAALRILTDTKIIDEVRDKGNYLLEQLQAFPRIYPSVIKEIRGRGLMLGVELTQEAAAGIVLTQLMEQKVLAAYTFNNPRVIRLEPPFIITCQELDYLVAAMEKAIKYAEEILI